MLLSTAMGRGTESTMEANQPKLTPREQAYLEHVRRAREQGVTLVEYCQKLGLKPRALYGVRRDLVRKGVLPRTRKTKKAGPGQFVAVRVTAAPATSHNGCVCRVRHPSGWVMECGSWPSAAWMAELMKGGEDAAA